MRSALSWFVGLAALSLPITSARAEPPRHAFQLEYLRSADAAVCPADGTMLRKELAKIMLYDPVKPDAPDRILATVYRRNHELMGQAFMFDRTGEKLWETELIPTTSPCRVLVGSIAAAIIAALPRLKEPEPPPKPPEPPPKPPDPPLTPPPPPVQEPPRAPPPADRPRDVGVYGGFDLMGSIGVTLTPSVGAGGFVGLRLREPALSFEVGGRVTGTVVGTDIPVTGGPGVRLRSAFTAGTIATCGHVRFAFFCAMGGAGTVTFTSSPDIPGSPRSAPFAIAGFRVGGQHSIVGRISLRYFVELAALPGAAQVDLAAGSAAAWVKPPGTGSMGLGITFDPW